MWQSGDKSQKSIYEESLKAAQDFNNIIQGNQPNAETLFLKTWGRLGSHNEYPDLYSDFRTSQDSRPH
jgi:hypothetical protein